MNYIFFDICTAKLDPLDISFPKTYDKILGQKYFQGFIFMDTSSPIKSIKIFFRFLCC